VLPSLARPAAHGGGCPAARAAGVVSFPRLAFPADTSANPLAGEPGDDYPYPPAHVHVNAQPGSYTGTKSFKDLHLPTGRVTVEGVARHLVTEHGIGPISDDWEAILSETEDAFRQIQRKRFRD
jgi:hypothetical protein